MEISATLVKNLRDKTGAGMMDCKKALTESGGDLEKAVDFLREKGIAKAASKSERETTEGVIVSFISADAHHGALVEISCETDFVARTDDFRRFATSVAEQLSVAKPLSDVDALEGEKYVKNPANTVGEELKVMIGKLGENMRIRRFRQFSVAGEGGLASYIHAGDKLAVMVELGGVRNATGEGFRTLARDVAMHIAAASPEVVRRSEMNTDKLNREREIYRQQAINEGKPEKILDKIVDGKVEKFYSESVLLEQAFVKNPDVSVGEFVKTTGAGLGEALEVTRFSRFRLGE